ncbi:MAG: glycerophosphodiester phosphodiesterase family protein [Victivallales bacterium]|nr:glycerophosphodiester phosphodiesterase family protein [Victivallales bacterium]
MRNILLTILLLTAALHAEPINIVINGVPLKDFVIVAPAEGAVAKTAKSFADRLKQKTEIALPVVAADAPPATHEIVLGVPSRDAAAPQFAYDDIAVYWENGSLHFAGGSRFSIGTAVNWFLNEKLPELLEKPLQIAENERIFSSSAVERDVYMADPTKLPVHWRFSWKPEDAMLQWQTKIDALYRRNPKRPLLIAHRSDARNYPENSIEGIISAYQMGMSGVELDLRFTKDGIGILQHDETLTRMTDFNDLKGKDGLPESAKVEDWTFAQIRKLHLREGRGGPMAALTPYVIPTLEEILTIAKERLFIILDKHPNWRYVEIDGIQSKAKPNYIFPIMQKTGNYTSCLIAFGRLGSSPEKEFTAEQALQVQKYIFEKSGQKPYFLLRGWINKAQTARKYAEHLKKESLTNAGVIINGAFYGERPGMEEATKKLCSDMPDVLFLSWTVNKHPNDNPAGWQRIYDAGIRGFMTDNPIGLLRFIVNDLKTAEVQ